MNKKQIPIFHNKLAGYLMFNGFVLQNIGISKNSKDRKLNIYYFKYRNEDIKVQRDLYSAYLIMNVNDDLKSINDKRCENRFDKFIEMHNREILRLQGFKNLSSMGV